MFSFDLHENEKVIELYRQTESVLFKPVIIVLLAIYLPIAFLLKYELIDQFIWFLSIWTLLVLAYAVYKYVLWLINVSIITNQRVIVISYKTPFSKQAEEMVIREISNIRFLTTGVFSSLFSFGTVEVETAESHQPLKVVNVKHPEQVKELIWKLKQNFLRIKPIPTAKVAKMA